MRISFLGTGSGSARLRAHTAIALECDDGTNVLLDAASGNTALKNARRLGLDPLGFDDVLLSHRHDDHAAGLAFIQFERALACGDMTPLRVHASSDTLNMVRRYCLEAQLNVVESSEDVGRNAQGREVLHWRPASSGRPVQLGPRTRAWQFPVEHIEGAVGWRVESGGLTVVFSGDTMYSVALVRAAEGADLLIHEAFCVGDQAFANARGHCTGGDAGQAAMEAGVSRLVLTHFPDSYHHRSDELAQEASERYAGPIELAHDLYQITLGRS